MEIKLTNISTLYSISTVFGIFYLGCEVGYYGRNCTNKCDHCKNSVTCGVQHGECDALGCINEGYQPPLCNGKTKCIIYFSNTISDISYSFNTYMYFLLTQLYFFQYFEQFDCYLFRV